jgi:leucyl aminopeptidase
VTLTFAKAKSPPIPLYAVSCEGLGDWLAGLPQHHAGWAKSVAFDATVGSVLALPNSDGTIAAAAVGMGDAKARARGRFIFAAARSKLPDGIYDLSGVPDGGELEEAALGWLLAGYRFDRYAKASAPQAQLVVPAGLDATRIEAIAAGEALTRDLINTPASDLGPDELETAVRNLAGQFGANVAVVGADDLIAQNFPMIHAVGRASDRAPRLIDMAWGKTGPRLTLVGKGVCFDTGGLNIKPASSMGLMKKDMGGAATVLGLAHMIMALQLPVRLRVLIPAVENSISSNAFRPQDILASRKGLSVEINNTDAEGRLVLADALALADEESPDLIVSMATLTGAARVAVGPDLAPFYATVSSDAQTVIQAAGKVRDPVWQLPFWDPYEAMIEPGIADLDNAPTGGMAGSITAALFLRRFVTDTPRYLHFDVYGWQPKAAPARPKGGVGQGARAVLEALPRLLDL